MVQQWLERVHPGCEMVWQGSEMVHLGSKMVHQEEQDGACRV